MSFSQRKKNISNNIKRIKDARDIIAKLDNPLDEISGKLQTLSNNLTDSIKPELGNITQKLVGKSTDYDYRAQGMTQINNKLNSIIDQLEDELEQVKKEEERKRLEEVLAALTGSR